ncbi:MAG: carbohydrate ABC transporter permease [Hyphomicrobiales bacterium]
MTAIGHDGSSRPGTTFPAGLSSRESWSEWFDRHSRTIFIAPAIVMILIFAIFPTIASLIIAVSRIRPGADGYTIRFVGLQNFAKQFAGNEQIHFLGRFNEMSALGWIASLAAIAAMLWWFYKFFRQGFTWTGFVGRLITAGMAIALALMFSGTVLSGNPWGTLGTTLFFVFLGCAIQFVAGLGLALLCSQPIWGKSFFRVIFFIPLMITPLGVGYAFRMIADTSKGPFAPFWQWLGLGNFYWAADPWAARVFIIVGDSWQWIPFIFVVLLAALENIPRDHVEAASVDGASGWQIFREITWPQIIPVAATVMLIRAIEAFKIVDLPNIMTAGGPGIATESMTLQAFFTWRANDFGGSAAVAYMLLFVTVVICSSFFNFVVLKHLRKT